MKIAAILLLFTVSTSGFPDCKKLQSTMLCVREFADRGDCHLKHWPTMVKTCKIFSPLDKILNTFVTAGRCTPSNYNLGVSYPIFGLSSCCINCKDGVWKCPDWYPNCAGLPRYNIKDPQFQRGGILQCRIGDRCWPPSDNMVITMATANTILSTGVHHCSKIQDTRTQVGTWAHYYAFNGMRRVELIVKQRI